MTEHVYIAVPCFGGLQQAQNARSITMLTHELAKLGTKWTLDHELHESLVQRARNSLMHRMLKSDATHLLFIDADIEFAPCDVIGMLAADKPLVCGAYPRKAIIKENVVAAVKRGDKDPFAHAASFVVNVLPAKAGETEVTLTADNGCVPVLDAATGFMLVKREVFLEMAAAMPETMYRSDASANRGECMHALFDCAIVDGRYLSEDFLFSRRWQNLGGVVYLFLPAKLGHVGSYTYRGDLFKTFQPVGVDESASSVAADGGATEWCDIPSLPDSDPQKRWHLYRYEWAVARLKGLHVANAACGTNYGSPILHGGQVGRMVIGFDRSRAAINLAYGANYVVDDIQTWCLNSYDALVTIETLEHLERPWEWIGNLAPSVKELILSVPIIPTKHTNPFHLHDFTDSEVQAQVMALGWRITDTEYQDEWQPKAVLLLRAER